MFMFDEEDYAIRVDLSNITEGGRKNANRFYCDFCNAKLGEFSEFFIITHLDAEGRLWIQEYICPACQQHYNYKILDNELAKEIAKAHKNKVTRVKTETKSRITIVPNDTFQNDILLAHVISALCSYSEN